MIDDKLTIYEVWIGPPPSAPKQMPLFTGAYWFRDDAEIHADHYTRCGSNAKVLAVSHSASAVRALFELPGVEGEVEVP